MGTAFRKTLPILGVLLLASVRGSIAGQISGSFLVPVIGYVLDSDVYGVRPILGIPGNSRIDEAIDLGFPVADAVFLPDATHAIVQSPQFLETLVVNLTTRSYSPIAGVSSSFSAIRPSHDGSKAALYYAATNCLLVIGGLPKSPSVQNVIDLSRQPALIRFAISNDGRTALLAFRSDQSDELFRWTSAGLSFVTTASAVSDLLFMGNDAVFADSQANEVVLLRNIPEQVSMVVLGDKDDDIVQPVALSLSSRNEIYIAASNSIFILDWPTYGIRRLSCNCAIATITPLYDSIFRLTDELYQPMGILDGRFSPERILFVPALSVVALEGAQ